MGIHQAEEEIGQMTVKQDEWQRNLEGFLTLAGWGGAKRDPLPGDASFRRYVRLDRGRGERCLLMDAPPPQEDVRPFVKVARHLLNCGASAPRILAVDTDSGFLLLEDFGEDTFTRILARDPEQETALYELAVDCLSSLHGNYRSSELDLPKYDTPVLLREAALFCDWYFPAVTGRAPTAAQRESYLQSWRDIFNALPPTEQGLVLRDFHVDNLMLLPGRPGVAACGLLDFQDALQGPLAYDLVSLLEDARRDIDTQMAVVLKKRYLEQTSRELDGAAFDAWYAALGAQRHAKVAGIFVRLLWRDGKDVYLKHVPRVIRLLASKLEKEPALAPMADWIACHFPEYKQPLPPSNVWATRALPIGS